MRDFPCGPVVKNPPCNAEDLGSIPTWETKVPHARWGDQNINNEFKNPLQKCWEHLGVKQHGCEIFQNTTFFTTVPWENACGWGKNMDFGINSMIQQPEIWFSSHFLFLIFVSPYVKVYDIC